MKKTPSINYLALIGIYLVAFTGFLDQDNKLKMPMLILGIITLVYFLVARYLQAKKTTETEKENAQP
jgi:hypothetical protein